MQHSSYTRDTQQDFFLYMEGLSDDLSIYLSIMLCPSTNRWYGLYSLHEKNKYISVKNNNLGISPLSYHQLLGWVGSGIYKINGNSIGHQPKRIDFMFVPVKNQQSTIPIICINRKNQLLIGERLSFNQHHFFCVCFSFSFC